MICASRLRGSPSQTGFVLISSLLLLLVVTLLAISMFRSFGIQEKIGGNVREKQRATQAANSVQEFAEWWLSTQSNAPLAVAAGAAATASSTCSQLGNANTNSNLQICRNSLVSMLGSSPVTSVPWNTNTGVLYTPPLMNIANSGAADFYAGQPRYYIADMGAVATGRGEVYKIDAYSFGLSATTVSVVESTVAVTCLVCNPMGP